jgi:hypothetical protein
MTPTFAIKKRVRYWYYVSSPLHQGRTEEAGSIRRVGAEAVERIILDAIGALPSIREILLPARSASAKLPRSERDVDAPDAAERIASVSLQAILPRAATGHRHSTRFSQQPTYQS